MRFFLDIPCTRYDRPGPDLRVAMALAYAAGLAGGLTARDSFARAILHAHDHKGTLHIALGKRLPKRLQAFIRQGWHQIALEQPERVVFLDASGEDWADIWDARRFE